MKKIGLCTALALSCVASSAQAHPRIIRLTSATSTVLA